MAHDPLVGALVGRYRITHVLGEGGMGKVYAAVHPEVGSRVAIKVLAEQFANDHDLVARFFAEARAVNVIHHENIVKVLDLVELPDGRPMIVMELLDGLTLRAVLHRGQVPLGSLTNVMLDVLAALAAVHAAGIVHRDLKPDNILIQTRGRAKVLDFGIAKLASVLPGQAPRTRTGAVLGTPEYMSPEQISGRVVDPRTDLYAAGVVLFEAIAGRRPFDAASDFEVMRAHVDTPPPPLRRPGLPASLDAIVMRALAKDPNARFATAGDMLHALYAASAELPPHEWRALLPDGPPFVRSPVPPHVPAPAPLTPDDARTLVVGRTREADATLAATPRSREQLDVTVRDRPSVRDALDPTVRDLPSSRERHAGPPPASVPPGAVGASRPRWLVPAVLGGVALVAIPVIAIVARTAEAPPTAGVLGSVPPERAAPLALVPAHTPPVPERRAQARAKLVAFDAREFDPIRTLPEAAKLARSLIPDATLVVIKSVPILPTGRVVLDNFLATPKDNLYVFRSPTRSRASDRTPRECYVNVEIAVAAGELHAYSYTNDRCDYPLVAMPRCAVSDVWGRARAVRSFNSMLAILTFEGDAHGVGSWYLDPSVGHVPAGAVRIADDCELSPLSFGPLYPPGAKEVDPVTILPQALWLARTVDPDARLFAITVRPVVAPGRFILDGAAQVGAPRLQFQFVAPTFARDVPNAKGERPCGIWVELAPDGAGHVRQRYGKTCPDVVGRRPRCTLAQVWTKAGMSAAADGATFTYADGRWDLAWRDRATNKFVEPTVRDDCR